MAQEQAVTALVYDARGAVTGAKEFEAASEKVKAANKNAAAASDALSAASERLQKAQDAVTKAAERVQKAQETAARAAERFGAQSEQAAQAAERVARATETASRAQDRLARAQDAAVTATERVAIGLGNQERRLASIEAKYAPAIAAENRLAQTKAYLNGVIERGGPQMERAQRLLEALTEQERKAAQASQQAAQAMAAGTAATVRAAQAQDMAAASTKRLNGMVQQVGFQVSDAANQIATGTNAFTVLGMQGGQLLGTLGPLGAAIGAVVNVAGVAAGIIQKQADAAAEAAKATDLLTAATRAGLEITESGVDKARRLRDERNEQAGASYRAAIAERELADAIAISASLSARAAMEQTKASNERYLAQGPGRFLGPAELSRIEYEKKVYDETSKTATETAKRLDEAQQAYEKFRSSLNKTGGFSGEEVDKLRERVDGIVSSYDDATLRATTLRQKQEELDEAVKAGVITQDKADEILQKYTKHLDENSKAAKEAAKAAGDREKAEEKLEKKILAAVKAADAKAVEEYTRVMNEGKKVYESTRTPAEKYADTLADLKRLLGAGAIDQDTFNRAVQAADPAFQEAKQAAERYAQEVNRVAEDIAKDWSETLYDAIVLRDKQASIIDSFRDLFKRIAIEALKSQIVLPITQQIVGSVPSLFGIQGGGSAANQNGQSGGLLSNGNMLSLGSKFLPTGNLMSSIDMWGYSTLGIGTLATTTNTMTTAAAGGLAAELGVAPVAGGVSNAAAAGSTTATAAGGVTGGLSGFLGAAGAGALGGMAAGYLGTATNSKAVGGLSGAALGAGASYLGGSLLGIGAMTGPVGLGIAAAVGLITGMLGTQKATVGKTSSADVTINVGGKSATYGNVQTDNDGDPAAGQALGTALSGIFSIAAMGGGSLTKDFGIGQTAAKGLYVGGSVPYKEFGEDIAGLLRYTLLEQGGLQGGGANTIKALQNTTAKDWEEATKDIALGASIDAGNTALREMVKTLGGVTDAAKKATTESFAPMFEELSRAQKLGIDGAYKALATDQLKAYLDQLRNPPDYTQMQTDVATLTGQFQAAREAYAQLNPAMVTYVDQIEKETLARLASNQNFSLDQQIREAGGRGYINTIQGFLTTLDQNARSLLAVGEPVNRAQDLFNVSLTELLRTLRDDQLADVVATFGGDIGGLATQLAAANDNVQQATRFEELFGQIRQDNINAEISALNEQKSAANGLLSSWKNLSSSIAQARQGLLVGDLSILDPRAKMDTALTAYRDALAKAQGGDVDAAGQVSGLAQTALQAARAFYASNEDYARIFNEVTGGLEGVESVASRQVSLASQQVSRLDAQLATQQEMLRALQASPADLAAILRGMNSGNAGDIATWATRQDAGTQAAVRRQRLEILGNADIERLFGGFSDIQAARAADPGFNLAAWFRSYGINEVLNGQRVIAGFADGGVVGNGMYGVDSVIARYAGGGNIALAGGEYVMPADQTAAYRPALDAMRAGTWGAANDRWGGNVMPFRGGQSGGQSMGGVETRLDAANRRIEKLTSTVEYLCSVIAEGERENIKATKEGNAAAKQTASAAIRQRARG